MQTADSTAQSPSTDSYDPPRWTKTVLQFSFLLTSGIIVWVLFWQISGRPIGWEGWTISIMAPSACIALFGLLMLRQQQTWARPVKELTALLPKIRLGEIPIDSLSEINGELSALAGELRSILQDLRIEKSRVAGIDSEVRQRVASRTDALERTIGSLRQQATHDSMTGLHNRRMLDRILPDIFEKCRWEKTDLALLMIDVDYFKSLNDTLGHAAGDQFLRNIGQIIRSTMRDSDVAFRCGGDEFLVLMPGATEASAEALAGRLNSLVNGLAKTIRIPQPPGLSIGISTLGQLRDPNPHELMAHADKRLYAIKSNRAGPGRSGATAHHSCFSSP